MVTAGPEMRRHIPVFSWMGTTGKLSERERERVGGQEVTTF